MDRIDYYTNRADDVDIYCYPGTEILINNKNIMDPELLKKYEKYMVSFALMQMHLEGFNGAFDIEHYKEIHKKLFEKIYPFAGKLRGINLIKGNTYFCRSYYVHSNLVSTLEKMKEDTESIHNYDEFIRWMSKYYLDLNLIHPFREGNGRTLREFLRQYVIHLNNKLGIGYYELDYSKMDKDALLQYTILDNPQLVEREFRKALVQIEPPMEKKYL